MSELGGPADPYPASTQRGDDPADPPVSPQADDLAADTPLSPLSRSDQWRARWPLLLVIVWAALAAVNLTLFGAGTGAPSARVSRIASGQRVVATARSPSARVSQSTPSPSPAVSPIPATVALAPVSATAYGPTGPESGDNPSHAYEAIESSSAAAWQSDWYRSAAFGNLQAGTGLLIDMGRAVTISAVQLVLGATPGADLQLLTGNVPDRSQMRRQASISDAAGRVRLTLGNAEPARYLLIWFTLLPPDSAGTYQVSVSSVMIEGTP